MNESVIFGLCQFYVFCQPQFRISIHAFDHDRWDDDDDLGVTNYDYTAGTTTVNQIITTVRGPNNLWYV